MPQANITYDTPYNRKLASRVNQLEEDMLWYNKHQYHPSPMGYRIGNFHNAQGIANTPNIARDYSYSGGMSESKVTGGGREKKYILNGNSPAYPPANMRAGMAVSSGGARYSGIDGAVGGSFLGDFKKGFDGALDSGKKLAQTASAIAPVAMMMAKAYEGGNRASRGRPAKGHAGRKALTRKVGGISTKDILSVGKAIAPYALDALIGLGRKASMTDKRKAVEDAIVGGNFHEQLKDKVKDLSSLVKKVAPKALKMMMEEGKKKYGKGFNFGKFLSKVGKAVAPIALDEGKKAIGLGKKSGGNILKDAIDIGEKILGLGTKKGRGRPPKIGVPKIAPLGSKKDSCGRSSGTRDYGKPCVGGVPSGGNILKDALEAVKPVAKKVGKKALAAAADEVKKSVGGGRAARAAIVKKIMKEKGLKMTDASKYVKEHNLYKK
jgi:hypothetical protein